MADTLLIETFSVAYGQTLALDAIDLPIAAGKVTVLAGPNGCGKSTLLRSIRRIHAARSGRILLDGENITAFREKALALRIGLLAQSPAAPDDMTVEELVKLGRYPHQGLMQSWSTADQDAVERAMAGTGVDHLSARHIGSLSGGQLQRVWIAMVLAQETPILCLDEPVNHLDMAHQIDCLDLVSDLNADHGHTIVLVLHDLNLAARYADELVFMKEGRIVAHGTPAEMMDEKLIASVFDIDCHILHDPAHDRPICIPLRKNRPARAVKS